ncbi:Rrf2 family transcriptional regulator [Shouchella plakortidis]|uniref:HTH-type transcriptional regulator NsrR n=1 Tax=Alkalicoccobacillus plakortidis TaxID=444060 RepID=A0ABT0XM08_9BACI|nr:Rrf2 family transcriptional regulator [Alkalicoccobacillus plakortidis]MCM2676259.1 Rrf2 family transcriptional regulator [Alkalicoccobacillus plakortidis]
MQLTNYTDYSLRTLLYVGSLSPDERAQVKDIAGAYQISLNHLQKIAYDLGKQGLLKTTRGKNGGVALAVQPESINIGALVRSLEDFGIVECFTNKDNCLISCSCKLKSVLHQAKSAFISVLDQYTLADLLENKNELYELFKEGQTK